MILVEDDEGPPRFSVSTLILFVVDVASFETSFLALFPSVVTVVSVFLFGGGGGGPSGCLGSTFTVVSAVAASRDCQVFRRWLRRCLHDVLGRFRL